MLDIADRETLVVLEAAPDCPDDADRTLPDAAPLSDAVPDALLIVEKFPLNRGAAELDTTICELSLAMGAVPDAPNEEADATLPEVAPLAE